MTRSRYLASLAKTPAEIEAAQRLRFQAFIADSGAASRLDGLDVDPFDDVCQHVLVRHRRTGEVAATLRLLTIRDSEDISKSYSSQFYDLDALKSYQRSMVELGRFCVAPGINDPDLLRVAWGAVTQYVEHAGAELLFGCSSFHGTNAEDYADAFAMLKERHIAPRRWLPRIKAPNIFDFTRVLRRAPDRRNALRTMPPLLRSYLTMGGWVSDHAVVDNEMNTLHVFTGLEIRLIPPARARSLRAVAG